MWTIATQINELTGDFARASETTNRLIDDVRGLTNEVKDLGGSLQSAKAFGLAAVILIPACAALVRWLVGGRLNDIRDQIYQSKRVPAVTAAPRAADKP